MLPVQSAFDLDLRLRCRMLFEADERGELLQLEVNVSGVSISDPEFSALIEPHLVALGPLARQLVIELTETAAVGNLANAIEFANSLAHHGVSLRSTTSVRASAASTT